MQLKRLENGHKRTSSPTQTINEDRIKKLEDIKKILEGKVLI